MRTKLAAAACSAVLLIAVSCGGDEPAATPATFTEACAIVEGCDTPTVVLPGPTEAIWRVLVVRDAAGAVRIEEAHEVDVSASVGPPQGPLGGSHGLAALDSAGMPLELQLVRFPQTLSFEGIADAEVRQVDLAGREVSTIGYLRAAPTVDVIAVVDASGTVLDSRPPPSPGDTGVTTEALVTAAPTSACAHALLIEGPSDSVWYPRNVVEDGFDVREPTPTQRAVVQAAMGRMNPMHCAGVGRIAFASFSSASTGGLVRNYASARYGDLVLINATVDARGMGISEIDLQGAGNQALLSHIVVHEAAHATTFLLQSEVISTFTGMWEPTERTLAEETIDRVRLRGGFNQEWLRLHRSFQSLAWAGDYGAAADADEGDERNALSPAQIAQRGFMSPYGMIDSREDIADFAAWPISGRVHRAAELPVGRAPQTNDYGCIAMREHTELNVPQALSVVFAKLSFLKDVGLVTQEDFDYCTGGMIGLPHDTEGFVVYEDGAVTRVFGTDPEGTIGTLDGRYIFEMVSRGTAEYGGENYGAELTLRLDLAPGDTELEKVSWPRGLYVLDPVQPHEFFIRLEGAPAGNFDVTDGFVLVAEATNDRIVGSVVVRGAFRYMAPIPVPQTFESPLQFRFLLEH